jgi:hypothetical protein
MTGASGGGSQTLFLSLLDDRIKAAAPINMISLRMQGGCPCENAAGLRRHTDNAEMVALIDGKIYFLQNDVRAVFETDVADAEYGHFKTPVSSILARKRRDIELTLIYYTSKRVILSILILKLD